MRPIRHRNDLIDMAIRNAPTKAVARLGQQGATVLGGFNPVESLPGWIVRIGGRLVGIEIDDARKKYRIVYLTDVPWKNWLGKKGGTNPLVDGDQHE